MTASWRVGLIGIVGSMAIACGGDGTGPSSQSIVGTWTATRIEIMSAANASIKEEFVSQGFTLTIAFSAGNTFAATSKWPGESTEGFNGIYAETNSNLTITQTFPPPTLTLSFARSLSGNTLTLSGADVTYNFGAGTVLAKSTWILARQ